MFSLPVHIINFARKDQWPQKQKSTGSLNKAWQHEWFPISQSFSSPLVMKTGELPWKKTPFGLRALHIQGRSGSALHSRGKSTASPQGILWLRRGDKTWDTRGFQRATRKGICKWCDRTTLLSDDIGLEQQPLPAAFPCQLSLPGWVSASGNEGALQCFTRGLISIHYTTPNLTASTEIGPNADFCCLNPLVHQWAERVLKISTAQSRLCLMLMFQSIKKSPPKPSKHLPGVFGVSIMLEESQKSQGSYFHHKNLDTCWGVHKIGSLVLCLRNTAPGS